MTKKVNKIVKAFLKDEPVGEDWYERRLKICETCPLNSKNKEESELSIQQKLTLAAPGCGGSVCTACGCCIRKKASLKDEACGRTEINKDPLWDAIEKKTTIDKNITTVNIDEDNVTIESRSDAVYIKVDVFKEDSNVVIPFVLRRKGGFDYRSYSAGCGCTTTEYPKKIEEDSYQFNVKINLGRFEKQGVYTKTMNIYYVERNKERSLPIKFKINKKT